MLFSTPFFLFAFLPIFLALYGILPARRAILLLGSLVFYGWSEPIFLIWVLASACIDWLIGRRIAAQGRGRASWLTLGVVLNLGLLVYAKYTIFAVENLNLLLTTGGWAALPVPKIALPLGVSFIVFEKITYLADIFRKTAPPSRSLLDYLNYVMLFPKLLAGPIVKYHEVAAQLARPTHRYEDAREGVIRFLAGLGKKVLIADQLAPVADQVFGLPAEALDPGAAWIGLSCFTLQIFFDFSGYSDMAIGLSRILGFRLLENFRDPYLATSFTDFWRRWHISLSTWIKEYVYIPLGGSRVSTMRSYANLWICFLLSGLWHGASWNFVIWGGLHGLALVADRAFWLRLSAQLPKGFNIALTLFLVMLSWVFFRCAELPEAWRFLRGLFGASGSMGNSVYLHADTLVVLAAGAVLILKPVFGFRFCQRDASRGRGLALAWSIALLILCACRMTVSDFNPFLYFRF